MLLVHQTMLSEIYRISETVTLLSVILLVDIIEAKQSQSFSEL